MATIRQSWLTTDYRWNEAAAQYIGANGRFVSRQVVNAALEQTIEASQSEMNILASRLQGGTLSVEEWWRAMNEQIKTLHTAEAALARGGWAQMTPSDWGWTGSQIKKQYAYLDRFAEQVASGQQPLNGVFLRRVKLYAQAGRATYAEMQRRYMRIYKGAAEERRVLGEAEHCQTIGDLEGCVELADKGWQPIGSLPALGETPCIVNCQCRFSFRDAQGNTIGG